LPVHRRRGAAARRHRLVSHLTTPILQVDDLSVAFHTAGGPVEVVRGVTFEVPENGVLAVVGESGSGKTVMALAILGLLSPAAQVEGSVRFRGTELVGMAPRALRELRGTSIGFVFEDPVTSLNPVYTVGRQIAEILRVVGRLGRREAAARTIELMGLVGIPEPTLRAAQYPHQLSSGLCQRVGIALAVANDPDLLIADEPTASLDVTVQAQVLDALDTVRRAGRAAMILISHDLGVVAGQADQVAVMYCGRVVERAPVADLFRRPRHPYTRGLLAALPDYASKGARGIAIEGMAPSPSERPAGCPFRLRCPYARPDCAAREPELRSIGDSDCACHFAESIESAG
jgi:peptide/nickel transport system ATP-binding protein